MVNVNKYIATVKHDTGIVKLITAASSEEGVVQIIMACEKCPRGAIISVKLLERIL